MALTITLSIGKSFVADVDGRLVTFAFRRAERLLAYLALNGPSDRSNVARALWPSVDRERALTSLRQALRAVVLAGGEGWIVADRNSLRLDERIVVRRDEGTLLPTWDEPWIHAAPNLETPPPFDALFSLVGWYRDRSPETAVGMIIDALPVFCAAPVVRQIEEVGPLIERMDRLPADASALCNVLGRAYYLQGDMVKSHALFGRIAAEIPRSIHPEPVANGKLSQVVILRESGAVRAAARLAAEVVASHSKTPFFSWNARYHHGYCLHLGGDREGLRLARAAVECDDASSDALTRLFPILNVGEGLIDGRDPACREYLREGRRLAVASGDALGLLNVEMLESLWMAQDTPDAALPNLQSIEKRAWEARLTPFATGLSDRVALLAHRLGRKDESRRFLVRGDRVRKQLGLRRTPLERARLAALA